MRRAAFVIAWVWVVLWAFIAICNLVFFAEFNEQYPNEFERSDLVVGGLFLIAMGLTAAWFSRPRKSKRVPPPKDVPPPPMPPPPV